MGDLLRVREGRFQALYDACGRSILGYVLRRAGGTVEAADVVSEVFVVAWRRIDDVPAGDEGRLWLYGVARNVLANHRRADVRHMRIGELLAAAVTAHHVPDPGDDVGTAAVVHDGLAALPAIDREVLQLAIWEELSAVEIGVVLDIPAATVRTRLFRARARMRDLLGDVALEGGRSGGDERSSIRRHVRGDERPLVGEHGDAP